MTSVRGVAQHYAWGDPDSIPQMLGVPADGMPWAEWWIGTHPGGPATLDDGRPLRAVSGDLPFLVKLLAAADALSLQTHPDAATARAGFERERAAGVPIDDARRIYRDPFAKPELLCALTEFDALCGFRAVDASIALLHEIGASAMAAHLAAHGIEATVTALYRGGLSSSDVADACASSTREEARLVTRLALPYPADPSVAVTLLLNRVRLSPGDAIFLGPGNLHAYLHGFGVEVMGASDNVVRGGLTVKHVDVDELLGVLSFQPLPDPVLRAARIDEHHWRYATPLAPFQLSRIECVNAAAVTHTAATREVLVCTDGNLSSLRRGDTAYLSPGEQIALAGTGTVFCVAEQVGH